jgi:predicted amidophosphoribosyltransferase
MNCKNCTYQLKTSNKFCPNCGAKIIHNRLTIKSLWGEISRQIFNYDNTFFKTVRHMFTQPEVVIDNFINGTRK